MAAATNDFRPHVGVHLLLIQDGRFLLIQRANTGFADGDWSVPGGCLDEGESLPEGAAREGWEELGVKISTDDLAFAHLCHHADPDDQARIGVFFAVTRWTGELVNAEPEKCSQIGWFAPTALPSNTVSYIRTGIHAYQHETPFSLDGWLGRVSG